MNREPLDHAPIVEGWLKEPTLLPPSDTARLTQLVHQTPQQRHWWQRRSSGRSQAMLNVLKFAAASVVLAVFGGFLYAAVLSPQGLEEQPLPALMTSPEAGTMPPVTDALVATPDETDGSTEPLDTINDDGSVAEVRFNTGTGETVAGWTQVGRRKPSVSGVVVAQLDHLQALGDRLVATTRLWQPELDGPSGPSQVVLHSEDGMVWTPVVLPGASVEIMDLATTADGLLAGGSVEVNKERKARMWASDDGVEWTRVPAPPAKRVHQIVMSEGGTTLVRAGAQVWMNQDGTDWSVWNRVPNSSILSGPGGLLTWQGGTDEPSQPSVPTVVLHQADPSSPVTEVALPEPLAWKVASQDDEDMAIEIYAVDDQWIMVGSENKAPQVIHVSDDGLDWTDVPRPPGMTEGDLGWIATVGDELQAFSTRTSDAAYSGGIWTWSLGEEAALAEQLTDQGIELMDPPVEWRGRYVATGSEQNQGNFLTLWMTEPEVAG